jgi:hypothetical protein
MWAEGDAVALKLFLERPRKARPNELLVHLVEPVDGDAARLTQPADWLSLSSFSMCLRTIA